MQSGAVCAPARVACGPQIQQLCQSAQLEPWQRLRRGLRTAMPRPELLTTAGPSQHTQSEQRPQAHQVQPPWPHDPCIREQRSAAAQGAVP